MGSWFRIAYVVPAIAAFGCSSTTEPSGSRSTLSCKSNADCSPFGIEYACSMGECRAPSGSGGSGNFPPAQGALVEAIEPTAGGPGCVASTAPFVSPANVDPVIGTLASLNCDLSAGTGCRPNENVVIDGDNGASVTCTVSGGSDTFNVSASLGQGDVEFSVQGMLTASGGKAFVSSHHAFHGLQDPQCDVTIEPNKGQIVPGGIWASFNCTNFGDPSTAGGVGCTASGKFLFENCLK